MINHTQQDSQTSQTDRQNGRSFYVKILMINYYKTRLHNTFLIQNTFFVVVKKAHKTMRDFYLDF